MSLTVTYEMSCDFCGNRIGSVDKYELAPFVPVEHPTLPNPRVAGKGFGENMACEQCLYRAKQTLLAKTAAQEGK